MLKEKRVTCPYSHLMPEQIWDRRRTASRQSGRLWEVLFMMILFQLGQDSNTGSCWLIGSELQSKVNCHCLLSIALFEGIQKCTIKSFMFNTKDVMPPCSLPHFHKWNSNTNVFQEIHFLGLLHLAKMCFARRRTRWKESHKSCSCSNDSLYVGNIS